MNDRPIRVVLDTSSIIAYAGGSLDVGETITEVDDEDAVVAVPLLCLIEAGRLAEDRALLRVLADHPAVDLLDIEPDGWEAVADLSQAGGRTDAGCAASIALEFGATILTRQPGWYAGMGADLAIVDF